MPDHSSDKICRVQVHRSGQCLETRLFCGTDVTANQCRVNLLEVTIASGCVFQQGPSAQVFLSLVKQTGVVNLIVHQVGGQGSPGVHLNQWNFPVNRVAVRHDLSGLLSL